MIFTTTLALTLTNSSHGKVSLIVVNRSALNPVPLSLKMKVRPYRGGNNPDTTSLRYLDDPKLTSRWGHSKYMPWDYKGFTRVDRFSETWLVLSLSFSSGPDSIKFDQVRDIFICDNPSWSHLLISEPFMFVPQNLGRSTFLALALDSRLCSRMLVFWDPLLPYGGLV